MEEKKKLQLKPKMVGNVIPLFGIVTCLVIDHLLAWLGLAQ